MRGKYSPTVSAAYQADQDWFRKFCQLAPHGTVVYSPYDPDGYDSYGYDKNDQDRAGNHESDYYGDNDFGSNDAYDDALNVWSFDGIKPVAKY